MQPRQPRTPLQPPSQKREPRRPSPRKSGPLQGRNPLLAPPLMPRTPPPLPKLPSRPTKKSVSAPTSSPSGASSFHCPVIPPTIGSKPAANSSKKPEHRLSPCAPSGHFVRVLYRNTGMLPVRPADILSAAHSLADYKSAHRTGCKPVFQIQPPIVSIPGKHSFTFSISRLIANGFGINPRTPASCNNSWARFSSPLPVTRSSGGTMRGGTEWL